MDGESTQSAVRTSSRRSIAWKAALLLGVISGTFSTLLITLGAPRIGRSRAVDWMTIGTVALGANAVTGDSGWPQLASGVLVHQGADLAWAIVLFALARYWTYGLSPAAIVANRAADPRVWLFAASMSHAQLGQITWMRALLGEMDTDYRLPRMGWTLGPTPPPASPTRLLNAPARPPRVVTN